LKKKRGRGTRVEGITNATTSLFLLRTTKIIGKYMSTYRDIK
jgi:hypothetical protein